MLGTFLCNCKRMCSKQAGNWHSPTCFELLSLILAHVSLFVFTLESIQVLDYTFLEVGYNIE